MILPLELKKKKIAPSTIIQRSILMIDPKLDSKEIHLRMLLPIYPPLPALKTLQIGDL